MNDGINQMVHETMLNYNNNFEREGAQQIADELLHQDTTHFPPKPGILYYIRQTSSSKSLRSFPTSNLKATFIELLHQSDEDNEFYQNRDFLKGHQVDYFELAEIISDHFGSKHFPLYPDELNHLSGKDHSWWLMEGELSFSLSFKTHALTNKNEGVKIGPIGDINIALKRFPILLENLSNLIPIKKYSADDRSIQVDLETENDFSQNLKNLFLFGELSPTFDEELKKKLSHTYYYYLLELRALRCFWMEFEQKQYSPLTQ